MNTKTTNKWLKLLAVAAMLTVNASGAWAFEHIELKHKCKVDMDKFKLDLDVVLAKPVPEGEGEEARNLMRVMWASNEFLKIYKNSCPQSPAIKNEIAEWQKTLKESETDCKKLEIKSPKKCVPNAFR